MYEVIRKDDKITLEFVESIRKQEMEDRLKDITM